MTFWSTATQEQKLAQIDGGLELGMNASQIAMNCGAAPSTLSAFARYHGRHFGPAGNDSVGLLGREYSRRRSSVEGIKRAASRTGTLGAAAFAIFDHQPESLELEWPA